MSIPSSSGEDGHGWARRGHRSRGGLQRGGQHWNSGSATGFRAGWGPGHRGPGWKRLVTLLLLLRHHECLSVPLNPQNWDFCIRSHYFMANRWGGGGSVADFILLVSKITEDGNCSHEIKRCLLLGRKATTNLDRDIKKQRDHFSDKGPYSPSFGFSSSHVRMWELDYKEGWVQKNCGVEEDSWESLGQQGDQTSPS